MASTSTIQSTTALADPVTVTARRTGSAKTSLFGHALDAVNPLQHVPGVAQGYRAVVKDPIATVPKLIGHVGLGAAVAGPIGAAAGAGVFLVEQGFKLLGRLFGGGSNSPARQAADLTARIEQQAATPVRGPASAPSSAIAPVKGAWPQLSNDQFTSLLSAFQTASPAATAPAGKADPDDKQVSAIQAQPLPQAGADVALQIRANLAKYDSMRLRQLAETGAASGTEGQ